MVLVVYMVITINQNKENNMDDKINVLVISNEICSDVYFYTNWWSGYNLPLTVQTALKNEKQWGDESHLSKVIFNEMIKNSRETGCCISTSIPDGEIKTIQINHAKQTITLKGLVYSFSKYIKLDLEKFDF